MGEQFDKRNSSRWLKMTNCYTLYKEKLHQDIQYNLVLLIYYNEYKEMDYQSQKVQGNAYMCKDHYNGHNNWYLKNKHHNKCLVLYWLIHNHQYKQYMCFNCCKFYSQYDYKHNVCINPLLVTKNIQNYK